MQLVTVVESLALQQKSVAVIKIDAEASPGLKAKYNVHGYPTLMFLMASHTSVVSSNILDSLQCIYYQIYALITYINQ